MVRLRVRSTSKAWLLRVAINRCRDLTRAAHQKDTELDENLPAPDVLEEDGSVLDAIRTLPENYRNAIYLHYYEGYTAAEIGRMMAVAHKHGTKLAAARTGTVTYDAEGGDRR